VQAGAITGGDLQTTGVISASSGGTVLGMPAPVGANVAGIL
jgi:hypothetical protein